MAKKHFTQVRNINALILPIEWMTHNKTRTGWFSLEEVWCDSLIRINRNGSLSHIKTSLYKEGEKFCKVKIPAAYENSVYVVYVNYKSDKEPFLYFHKSCKIIGWGEPRKSGDYLNSSFLMYKPPLVRNLSDEQVFREEGDTDFEGNAPSCFVTEKALWIDSEWNAVDIRNPNEFFAIDYNEFRYVYADKEGWVLDGVHINPQNEHEFDLLPTLARQQNGRGGGRTKRS